MDSARLFALAKLLALALTATLLCCCGTRTVELENDRKDGGGGRDGGGGGRIGDQPAGDGAGIFGYSKSGNGPYFTQPIGAQMGTQLSSDDWGYVCNMTVFSVGKDQFLLSMCGKIWSITRIENSGDLGPVTDNGTWGHDYQTLIGCNSGGNTYIVGQTSELGDKTWFVQQVTSNGTLGTETSTGNWHDYYAVAACVEMDDSTYIFFHANSNDKSGQYWWIAELKPNGTLNLINEGHFEFFYPSVTAFTVGGQWYIFGQKTDGYWFIQQITADGNLGSETASGTWEYYKTVTSYTAGDGNTYLFGQRDSDNWWFIQQILPGGTIGPQTDNGTWGNFYDSVVPFTFDTDYLHMDNWMGTLSSIIGPRKLINITLPGSHDAGINLMDFNGDNCHVAKSCNTTAQYYDIITQLNLGSRYFDIRPVVYYDGSGDWGRWQTGHFDFSNGDGCRGEYVSSVFGDVGYFFNTESGHGSELVILKISHCYSLASGSLCASGDFGDLKNMILASPIFPMMVKCTDNCNLMDMTLNQILALGNVIVLVDGLDSDKANGIFSWGGGDLPIYDQYSNQDELAPMISDQIAKLETSDNHQNQLFLLSWTLTMDPADAVSCEAKSSNTTILTMAEEAHASLFPQMDALLRSGNITQMLYPNIIYIDAFGPLGTRTAMYLNKYDGLSTVLWSSGTSGHPGATLNMLGNGNLVITGPPPPIWASNTSEYPGATLYMQDDGNLVIYDTGGTARWETNTSGNPGARLVMQADGDLEVVGPAEVLWATGTWGHTGAQLVLQPGGDLQIVDTNGTVLWSSGTGCSIIDEGATLKFDDGVLMIFCGFYNIWQAGTPNHPHAYYVMQDDGNLVIYDPEPVLWGSGTAGCPGAYYLMQADGNLVIYEPGPVLWESGTVGHPGATFAMQSDGNLVIYDTNGTALWATNTYGHPGATLNMQPDGNLVIYGEPWNR